MRFSTLFLLTFAGTLLLTFAVALSAGYFTLKSGDREKTQNELKRQMGFLEAALEQAENWQQLAASIERHNRIRVTIIDAKGVVVAESRADKETMDNHLSRDEIQLARAHSEGFSTRFSDSTHTNHVYFARQVYIDETLWYLRIAMEEQTVQTNFAALWNRLLAVFALAVVATLWLAFWINRLMSGEVKRLAWLYRAIEDKQAIDPVPRFWIREFTQIAQAAERLSRKLAKRDKKKKTYQAKIRLKNRQQSEVLSAISHEFKNPIAIIQGYSETLVNDSQMPDGMRQRFLNKVLSSSRKLTAMLDRFVLATRLESEEFQLSLAEVPLMAVAKECVQTFWDRYPDRQVLLEGDERTVRADRMLLEMVLSNLIDNALKYSSEAVTLRIEPDRVAVIDRGIGIEAEELQKVTKKFYRASKLSWDNSMGLGLAIVNFALKRHGTQLEIESQAGAGSTFSFRI